MIFDGKLFPIPEEHTIKLESGDSLTIQLSQDRSLNISAIHDAVSIELTNNTTKEVELLFDQSITEPTLTPAQQKELEDEDRQEERLHKKRTHNDHN